MKTENKKRLTLIAGVAGALVLVAVVIGYFTSVCHMRSVLKSNCGTSVDFNCECFSNVVDNRLSDNQVRAFNRFLKSVKVRPTTNILEFVDEVSAREISNAVAVCRPRPVVQEQPKAKGRK